MNIYFVNKRSTLKGPYDITDANGDHIIRSGDICFCDKEKLLLVLMVDNINKWNSCLLIGSSTCHPPIEGNKLVYAFNGLNKRGGSVSSLSSLIRCFPVGDVVAQLLQNAIDILEYKADYFDINIFQRLIVDRKTGQRSSNGAVHTSKESTKEPTFLDYLNDDLKTYILEHQKAGLSMRTIYTIIRNEHPKEFREALMQFLEDAPKGSIYNI